ncbi:toprim domain-containing protein [Peribacillus sp. SI8-4]|uniref:toprim domain-containing protein n=1 Tax=Peribacillus sp. SI8-4 TaxID=3048009 RepID=UPI00255483EF|nr:toprim domain-containing protein [Peribacillus sp. SI8-4]
MECGGFDKVIIVEGSSDRKKVASVLNEDVEIRCTNGTISITKLDELVEELMDRDVYLLFDADESGERLRKQFRREMPEANHLYINKMYKEVESSPEHHIAIVLLSANMNVKMKFLS